MKAVVGPRLVGVLGGMGPLATVDFMRKVIAATGAERDQDHVPLIVHQVPQIPERVPALLAGRDDPLPAMLAGLARLEQAGAQAIAIPCHTAHYWYDKLAAACSVPILHFADAIREHLSTLTPPPRRLALLATHGTLHAGIYQRALAASGRTLLVPDAAAMSAIVAAIAAVKRNDLMTAGRHATAAGEGLLEAGADHLLLACTELPLAFETSPLKHRSIDATACLAAACVAFSLGGREAQGCARRVG